MTTPAATADSRPSQSLRRRYSKVLGHLRQAQSETDECLSENQAWSLIARSVSPRWAAAYSLLQAAEQAHQYMQRAENKPLGAIGAALCAETTAAEKDLLLAQIDFTLVDERLRSKRGLQRLLAEVMQQQRTVSESLDISESVFAVTIDHDVAVKVAPPTLSSAFGGFARKLANLSIRPRKDAPQPAL